MKQERVSRRKGANSRMTYQERLDWDWRVAVERLKNSGRNLGKIRIVGVEKNYAKRNIAGD